jgi:hypothetical protein
VADGEDDDGKPYKVGYGKPPKHTRFEPGRSGNPKGRPKGAKAKTMLDVVADALNRPMRVRKANGKVTSMPTDEALIASVLQGALQGNTADRKLAMSLMEKTGRLKPPPAPAKGGGVVVVRRPAASVDDWTKEFGGQRLPLDPLVGLPGIDPALMKQLKRRQTPEDDD